MTSSSFPRLGLTSFINANNDAGKKKRSRTAEEEEEEGEEAVDGGKGRRENTGRTTTRAQRATEAAKGVAKPGLKQRKQRTVDEAGDRGKKIAMAVKEKGGREIGGSPEVERQNGRQLNVKYDEMEADPAEIKTDCTRRERKQEERDGMMTIAQEIGLLTGRNQSTRADRRKAGNRNRAEDRAADAKSRTNAGDFGSAGGMIAGRANDDGGVQGAVRDRNDNRRRHAQHGEVVKGAELDRNDNRVTRQAAPERLVVLDAARLSQVESD